MARFERIPKLSLLLLHLLVVPVVETVAEEGCADGEAKLTVVTYNTGLIASVPEFYTRRLAIPQAVADTAREVDADVLCLQELWHERDLERVIQALESDFPYHYSALHTKMGLLRDESMQEFPSSETAPCGEEIQTLAECVQQNCSGAESPIACTVTFCGHVILGLPDTCRACITLTATDIRTVLAECADYETVANRYNLPGLLVASRRPMKAEYSSFTPKGGRPLIERGYITAKVEGAPTVVCTHFTCDITTELGFTYMEAGLPYRSYKEQQRAEIKTLDTEFSGTPHVLLGDLNTGPAGDGEGERNLSGDVPENYALLESVGYENHFLQEDGRCTHCVSSNSVIQKQTEAEGRAGVDKAIDHILTYSITSVRGGAQRLFDRPEPETLSDHYGVKLDVCVPDSSRVHEDL